MNVRNFSWGKARASHEALGDTFLTAGAWLGRAPFASSVLGLGGGAGGGHSHGTHCESPPILAAQQVVSQVTVQLFANKQTNKKTLFF